MKGFKKHTKLFRPHYLVMTGEPDERLHLAQFVASLRKGYGITVYGNVLRGTYDQTVKTFRHRELDYGYFEDTNVPSLKVRGFRSSIIAPDLRSGTQSLLCCSGLGVMRPNTLVLGFKKDWKESASEGKDSKLQETTGASLEEYVDMIRDSFQMGVSVMVARNLENIQWSEQVEGEDEGYIDIYWLKDDGGLTLLIPYILSLHQWWKDHTATNKVPIRLMLVGDLETFAIIRNLVDKLRIPVEFVECDFNAAEVKAAEHYETYRSKQKVFKESKKKNEHWLKIANLVRENSQGKAKAIFVTLPYPLAGIDPSLYMSWLDELSKGDTPVVLLRGVDENVLTFYLDQ